MKLHKEPGAKKQLTVADLKRGEIGTTGDGAAVFNDGTVFQGIKIDNGSIRAVIFTHGSFLNATYPVGSKLVLDFANDKIEVLPPNEEPKPQPKPTLTTGDLKPGEIGETYGGNFVMCFVDGKRYFLGPAALPNDNAFCKLTRILPAGTLLEVE